MLLETLGGRCWGLDRLQRDKRQLAGLRCQLCAACSAILVCTVLGDKGKIWCDPAHIVLHHALLLLLSSAAGQRPNVPKPACPSCLPPPRPTGAGLLTPSPGASGS